MTKMQKIFDEFREALIANKITYPEFVAYTTKSGRFIFMYNIYWGDWKHEHLRFRNFVNNYFSDYDIEINECVTEEDGSDYYSAQYVFAIKKRK